jgi:GT2 family glycosyltransferase
MLPVIIPFYKNRAQLDRCIGHLSNQTIAGELEIFIRDNSEDNILFTAAVNLGLLKYAFNPGVDYVVALNQDAYLEPNALEKLRQFMQATPACGIATPLQVLASDPDRVICGGTLAAFPIGKHRTGRRDAFKSDVEQPWANGCCMMIRTSLIKQIGVLDPNMRFLCSDSDYSFTARARGAKTYTVVEAVVRHEVGQASRDDGPRFISQVKFEDLIYFTNKWLSGNLYRSLAYEGATFDARAVETILSQLAADLDYVKSYLSTPHFATEPSADILARR